jgi:transcriptional regulator, XRE family|nr:MAG TPA: repressor protein [Caudoviricetes sp.]
MFDKNIFSERLILLRKNKSLSTRALAAEIGISQQAISQFEKQATYPHCNTLCALADYFQVSLDYLAGRSDNPEINK